LQEAVPRLPAEEASCRCYVNRMRSSAPHRTKNRADAGRALICQGLSPTLSSQAIKLRISIEPAPVRQPGMRPDAAERPARGTPTPSPGGTRPVAIVGQRATGREQSPVRNRIGSVKICKNVFIKNNLNRRRQLTEKQRRRETERARERRRKMTGEALQEWRKRHAENARRRRAALLQERLKIQERVKTTLSLQQYPKSFSLKCGLCPCTFNNRWQLIKHREKAHCLNSGQFKCETCGKIMAKASEMIIHKQGCYKTTLSNMYPIKNNTTNHSIPFNILQENNHLPSLRNKEEIFNSAHYTSNSNELLSNSFHQSNFTNYLSRFNSQYQPNTGTGSFFSRNIPMERNEITGSSYKMLTDYIKQSEMMKHDYKLTHNVGYQTIHHFENNFDQELTNLPVSNIDSLYGNYSSHLSNDVQGCLSESCMDDQGYKFPSHVLKSNQFPNQNSTYQSAHFEQEQIFQSIYEWEYQHNRQTQSIIPNKDLSRSNDNNQHSLTNLSKNWQNKVSSSDMKQEDNYSLKVLPMETENEQIMNQDLKTFSILQSTQNKCSSVEKLCADFIQSDLKNWSSFDRKSITTTLKRNEGNESVEETSFNPNSGSMINNCKQNFIKLNENKSKDIYKDSAKCSTTENKQIYENEQGNGNDVPHKLISQVQAINDSKEMTIVSKDCGNKKNIQSLNCSIYNEQEFLNCASKSLAPSKTNVISSVEFIEELESEIKFCISQQPNVYIKDQNISKICDNNIDSNKVQISDISFKQNKNKTHLKNIAISEVTNNSQNKTASQEKQDEFTNFKMEKPLMNQLVHFKSISDITEHQLIEKHDIPTKNSEKENHSRFQNIALSNTSIEQTQSLTYPTYDNTENNNFDNSAILPVHNLQEQITCPTNDANICMKNWCPGINNKDVELNITISNFSNFYKDTRGHIDKNSESTTYLADSQSYKKIDKSSSKDEDKECNTSICKNVTKITDNKPSYGKSIHMEILNVIYDNESMCNTEKNKTLEKVNVDNHCTKYQNISRKDIQSQNKIEDHLSNKEPVTSTSNSPSLRNNTFKIDAWKNDIPISNDNEEKALDISKNIEIINTSPCNIFNYQSSSEEKISQEVEDKKLYNELPNKNIIKLIKCKGENGIPHYRISKICSPNKIRQNTTEIISKADNNSFCNFNSENEKQASNILKEVSNNGTSLKHKLSSGKNENKLIYEKSKQMNLENTNISNRMSKEQTSLQFFNNLQNTNSPMPASESQSISLEIENKFPKMKIRKIKMSLTNGTSTITQSTNFDNYENSTTNEDFDKNETKSLRSEENIPTEIKKLKLTENVNKTSDLAKNKDSLIPGLLIVNNNDNKLIMKTNEEYDKHQITQHAPNINQNFTRPHVSERNTDWESTVFPARQIPKSVSKAHATKRTHVIYVSKTRKALLKHNRYKHNADIEKKKQSRAKNHVCGVCGRKFVFGHLLQDHMNSHTGDTPYMCMICGTRLSMRSELMCHVKLHRQQYT
ncbi:hypothetical protein L9F63_009908, partial [Diploptera punctata]